MKPLDLTGRRFGKLVGVKRVGNNPKYGQAVWQFKCDCGSLKETFGFNVVHGRIVSCGCKRKTDPSNLLHGMSESTEFYSWLAMRQRCLNPKSKAYPNYGGRGIGVCEAWSTFAQFFADMGIKPKGCSLERVNNDLGYSPDNCIWGTKQQQVRNRRVTVFYEHDGLRFSLGEWAERIGISYQTLWARYKAGKRGSALLSTFINLGGDRVSASYKSSQ